jgi:hypothetical protein
VILIGRQSLILNGADNSLCGLGPSPVSNIIVKIRLRPNGHGLQFQPILFYFVPVFFALVGFQNVGTPPV